KERGLFELWCKKSGNQYKENFTLCDIMETLPKFTTTGVSEPRAILHVSQTNHAKLKKQFQIIFEEEWKTKVTELKQKFGIEQYECVITNGTKETHDVSDFSLSQKGGLKIIFKDKESNPIAFIWMRGSGTEPVFRIMCDVQGDNPQMEKELLEWETKMIQKADKN
ncbi:MAG: phosphoglucomutase, partial [Treponema sp.]|nr:phosphoglucomutase [Treponema sp.]